MKPALSAAAIAALDALIVDLIAPPPCPDCPNVSDPARYLRAAKLCGMADQLRQMTITRVADYQHDGARPVGLPYIGADPNMRWGDNPGYDAPEGHAGILEIGGIVDRQLRAPRDAPTDMIRQFSDLIPQLVKITQRPQFAADELAALTSARESLAACRNDAFHLQPHDLPAKLATIDAKIASLIEAIATTPMLPTPKDAAHAELRSPFPGLATNYGAGHVDHGSDPDMVPAEFLGGHPPGRDG